MKLERIIFVVLGFVIGINAGFVIMGTRKSVASVVASGSPLVLCEKMLKISQDTTDSCIGGYKVCEAALRVCVDRLQESQKK